MIVNAMLLNEGNELFCCEPRHRGFAEMRISGNVVGIIRLEVGKVTPAAPGDADLLSDNRISLDENGIATSPAGFDCAHEPGSTGPYDYYFTASIQL